MTQMDLVRLSVEKMIDGPILSLNKIPPDGRIRRERPKLKWKDKLMIFARQE